MALWPVHLQHILTPAQTHGRCLEDILPKENFMSDPHNTFSLGGSLVKVLCPVLSSFVKHFTSTQTHDMCLEDV